MGRHDKSMERHDRCIAPGLHDRLLNKLGLFWGEIAFWAICLALTAMVLYAIAVALVTAWHFPAGTPGD